MSLKSLSIALMSCVAATVPLLGESEAPTQPANQQETATELVNHTTEPTTSDAGDTRSPQSSRDGSRPGSVEVTDHEIVRTDDAEFVLRQSVYRVDGLPAIETRVQRRPLRSPETKSDSNRPESPARPSVERDGNHAEHYARDPDPERSGDGEPNASHRPMPGNPIGRSLEGFLEPMIPLPMPHMDPTAQAAYRRAMERVEQANRMMKGVRIPGMNGVGVTVTSGLGNGSQVVETYHGTAAKQMGRNQRTYTIPSAGAGHAVGVTAETDADGNVQVKSFQHPLGW